MTPTDLKLYELFSDKTLSEGCVIEYEWFFSKIIDDYWNIELWRWYVLPEDLNYPIELNTGCVYNNIWHEPQLHDLFRVAKEKGRHLWQSMKSFMYWHSIENVERIPYNPTLSLLDQDEQLKWLASIEKRNV